MRDEFWKGYLHVNETKYANTQPDTDANAQPDSLPHAVVREQRCDFSNGFGRCALRRRSHAKLRMHRDGILDHQIHQQMLGDIAVIHFVGELGIFAVLGHRRDRHGQLEIVAAVRGHRRLERVERE